MDTVYIISPCYFITQPLEDYLKNSQRLDITGCLRSKYFYVV